MQISESSYCFLSFDDSGDNWKGKIWTTDENGEENMIDFFDGYDKSDIIEKAKCWAFENNYNVEW